MIQNIESNDVPVTRAFLSLVQILHNSRGRFIAETSLAEDLGLPAPKDYWERCKDVISNEFREQFKAAGLTLNEITFRSLMHLEVDVEVLRTNFTDLPLRFTFDPWLHMGKGGIERAEQELQRQRQHA